MGVSLVLVGVVHFFRGTCPCQQPGWLMNRGRSLPDSGPPAEVNICDHRQRTPIHLSAAGGHTPAGCCGARRSVPDARTFAKNGPQWDLREAGGKQKSTQERRFSSSFFFFFPLFLVCVGSKEVAIVSIETTSTSPLGMKSSDS